MHDRLSKQEPVFIQDQQAVSQLCEAIAGCLSLALDTEFHAENRYEPEFMLLQLAALDGRTWIIDPKAVSLFDLGQALKGIEIIVHGGQEDIRLLQRHLSFVPEQVFDTQIAAALLGEHYPIRLDQLLFNRLNLSLSKKETLNDWSRRPLSSGQIRYAAEDAVILLDLKRNLSAALEATNRVSMCEMACKEMRDKALLPASNLQWMEWFAAESLTLPAQRILTRLLDWRELTASQKGKPPNYILPRSIALHLARNQPRSKSQLYANRRINRGLIQKHGKELLTCIEKGLSDGQVYRLPMAADMNSVQLLLAFAAAVAHEMGIHRSLLMPNAIATAIVLHGASRCTGWRKTVFGERLQQFLSGQLSISLGNSNPVLTNRADLVNTPID